MSHGASFNWHFKCPNKYILVTNHHLYFHKLGCQTIWHSICWDIGQDTYGRRWRILYTSARNSKGQGTAWKEKSEKQTTESSIQMHDTLNWFVYSPKFVLLMFFSIMFHFYIYIYMKSADKITRMLAIAGDVSLRKFRSFSCYEIWYWLLQLHGTAN